MNFNKIWAVLIVVFVLTGCNNGTGPSISITDQEIRVGTEGLVIDFIDNMPPVKVYETDTFPVGLKLYNKGAFDIKESYILLNIEQDNVGLVKDALKRSIKLDGKSAGNPYGDSETINYLLKANELGKEVETITSNILVTTCYKYQTISTNSVCVDTDYYNLKNAVKSCSAAEITSDSGQGGPISITKIEPQMMEEDNVLKPAFMIYIKNNGNGQVFSSDMVSSACSEQGISRESINYLGVEASFGSEGASLDCRPSAIKLKDNEAVIRCIYDDGIDKNKPAYSTVLRIILDYGYTQTMSKQVEIKGQT